MTRAVWVEEALGETRAALVEDGRVAELRLRRWSDARTRAFWGDVFVARARAADPRQGGLFVDLGLGPEGFLPWRSGAPRPPEGAALLVGVAREATGGKGPGLVALDDEAGEAAAGPAPRRVRAAPLTLGWPGEGVPAGPQEAEAIDEALDAALAPMAPIAAGGALTIEPTAALVAIDVDAEGRRGGGDQAAFLRGLNQAAAAEAARQLRLRDLAGLIAVDFVGRPRAADAHAITRILREGLLKGPQAGRVDVAPVSSFGVLELARERRRRSLREICCGPDGALSGETVALAGLRAALSAARDARGRPVTLAAPPAALDWLNADAIGWRAAWGERGLAPLTLAPARPGARRAEAFAS